MRPTGIRVLMIEDDAVIREATSIGLERLGYHVLGADDGLEGLDLFRQLQREAPVDAVLLDVMLPTMNGTQICRELRSFSNVPVIMLSARSEGLDMVTGLDAGADDYLAKPFDLQVLDARLRAVLRRTDRQPSNPGAADHRQPQPKPLDIDPYRLVVRLDGHEVHLTPTEMKILLILGEDPGVVVSRSDILAEVWGYSWDADHRVIDVHVQRLRRKIGASRIETVRGFGYRLQVRVI
ncbi:response regulator transcription factor [Glutamicibacter sp. MNS18]|uniref:response regulator transcription factor n=1 Tax=Glutamicibacter sp. MNS18 TaxID=2989817 RepID=UPI002236418C|nr:response regulator transcription factor [Glutamicibacter sp. MNS18]MCW4466764.1 response regulator transcription factor [Glutamicibacter sp. MNS18]